MNLFRKILLTAVALLSFTIASAQQDTIRVRVMTYNLRFGELASLDDLAAHIRAFKPDFVALQEVDVNTQRTRAPHQNGKNFISELAYRTNMFGIYGKSIDYSGGYYGIGILSKHPYISIDKTMLPNPEKNEQRVLLEGMFEVKGDTLVFASTHLDVSTESTRNIQSKFLCSHFENYAYPILFGGDFNANYDTEAIVKIMNKSWLPVTNTELTYPAWNPRIKIDHIFARPMKGWKVVKTQTVQSLLSDHLPIITDLEYIK